jgi:hypothetical protein
MIALPPAAPPIKIGRPSFSTIYGQLELNGRFRPLTRFVGDGSYPKPLGLPSMEKSSILSFKTNPHLGTMIPDPQGRPTVVVTEHMRPEESAAVILEVPWSALANVALIISSSPSSREGKKRLTLGTCSNLLDVSCHPKSSWLAP